MSETSVRNGVELLVEAAVLLVLVSILVGQVLGQPVLLGFVTTGSMQPTLGPGDGYIAIPAAISGPVDQGDVVTFRAEEIEGGGLTTHRVVGETDQGYVTKGDDNPFTDQGGGEPPVKRTQIVAVAWQPGGSTLAIPGVGVAVTGTRDVLATIQRQLAGAFGTRTFLGTGGLAYLLLVSTLVAYAVDVARERSGGRRRRRNTSRESGTDTRLLVAVFAVALVLAMTATMVASSGPREFGIVSAVNDAQGISTVAAGTNESVTYVLGNGGAVPMVAYLEPTTDGVTVQPQQVVVPGQGTVNTTLTLSAPSEPGYYRRYVVEHRYLLVLPQSVIYALYEFHPWLPVLVIDALVGIPFYLLGMALTGTGHVRSRRRDGPSRASRVRSRLSYRARNTLERGDDGSR